MPVFKPKTRTISLRLSEEEYRLLQRVSLSQGARSVSDYARDALFQPLHALVPNPSAAGLETRMNQLASQLETINQRLDQLRRMSGENEQRNGREST